MGAVFLTSWVNSGCNIQRILLEYELHFKRGDAKNEESNIKEGKEADLSARYVRTVADLRPSESIADLAYVEPTS